MNCSSFAHLFRVRYFAVAFGIIAFAAVCGQAAVGDPVDRSNDSEAVGSEQVDFGLSIDSASGLPNDEVILQISLDNSQSVAGFTLLVEFDPTMATYVSADNSGSRTSLFEEFVVEPSADGQSGRVRVTGTADLEGGAQVAPLAAGSGVIAQLTLRLSGDLDLIGLATAVRFVTNNRPDTLDNTLTDGAGATVQTADIAFAAGQIMVEELGQLKLGDINLNGLAFEVGDAILLTNFIMSPEDYPLNLKQLANSDVNNDGFAASVADLVFMINRLTARLASGEVSAEEMKLLK